MNIDTNNSCVDCEPDRHLCVNPSHSFSWRILCKAQSTTKHTILDDLLIHQWKPSLNRQVHYFIAKLSPASAMSDEGDTHTL